MHYKAPDNSVHFVVPEFAHLLPAGSVQITDEEAEALRPVPQALPIVVSPRQIRQALTASGLRSQVESAVAAGDQDTKDWWEFATAFEENHPRVLAMAAGLGVSNEQLHSLFELAASL
jgi:hypothetical protein